MRALNDFNEKIQDAVSEIIIIDKIELKEVFQIKRGSQYHVDVLTR